MLSLGLLFTSLLLGFAAAQNSSSVNLAAVDLTTRNQWCSGELANCPLLCGGPTATKSNTCSGSNLQFQCICSNGSAPASIDQYADTWPNHVCQETFSQCRTANPGSNACVQCGTLKAADVPSATTSSASSAAPTQSSTGSAPAPSATGKSDAMKMGVEGIVFALVGGALGVAALVL